MNSKKSIVRYIEVFLDVMVMFTSYLIANRIKFGFFRTGLINRTEHYLTLFLLEFAVYVVVYFVAFRNDNIVNRKLFQEIYAVGKMYAYIIVLTSGCIYFAKMGEYYSRVQMFITFIISPIATVIVRQIFKRLVTKEYHRSGANEKIMLVTTSDQVENVIKIIKTTRNWDFRISNIAIVDCDRTGQIIDKIEIVANGDNLMEVLATAEIDSVFVHLPNGYVFDQKAFVTAVNDMGKTVYLNVNEYEMKIGERRLDFLGRYAVVTWKNKTYRLRYLLAKKGFDLIFGLFGSLLIIPVWIFAFIGKLVTGDLGPVIITIVRVGKNGRRFYYHKFRTMYMDAVSRCDKWIMEGKKGVDPRYTPVGWILKKTKLENLPSTWNVLWGDMSIVGNPAPSLPEFLDYSDYHRKSLSVKPGVFGFWQAYADNGERLSEEEQSEFDREYILNCTLGLDIRIVFRIICPFCKSIPKAKFSSNALAHDEMKMLDVILNERKPLRYRSVVLEKQERPSFVIYKMLKRLADIVLSALALIVLSPVFIVLGICVKVSDGGSVFYGHTRIGYKGKKISVYKFRSMKTNAGDLEKILTPEQLEQYVKEFKIDNDPRITKIGGFLRKTSLDELPQLINILKGELSIVGPRPIVEKETEIYGSDIAKLLSVKPGLTGYWQAYARNNATYESGERQRMEMYYVEHCSLWLDIKILFRTVFSVIRKDGAQ